MIITHRCVCKVSTRLPTALCCNIAVSRYVGRWPWLRVFCNHNCANLFPHNGYTPADSQAHSNHVLVANHYVARTGHCSTSHITHSQTQFWVGSETVYSVIPIAVVMHLLWSIILQIKFILSQLLVIPMVIPMVIPIPHLP